jgi:hypothetical protein
MSIYFEVSYQLLYIRLHMTHSNTISFPVHGTLSWQLLPCNRKIMLTLHQILFMWYINFQIMLNIL